MQSVSYVTFIHTILTEVRFVLQCVPLATEPGNEDIATKFEQEYVRCVKNENECVCSVCL